ncbi:uncharacterized protein EV154DRAFT_477354 [Mucor mucedo]|uniref:uncharacterized protein n=1 Tax=Mucor mucedo TaxID=29922 RepID=UPI00221FF22A|nr:uncharacterized protein EV154DRAFT_477354 [Mucor mucedo]KAI7895556.1 hypothetical protein EV154DRAFT_477354 [Mucor mucedo]
MDTFKSLPHEILEIILSYAGDHVKNSQLMAVNRNWYNIYLSLVYTAPVIDLDSEPSEFYGITDSPFRPGQYTTSITFRSFSPEPECTQSRLYRLMMHTPHVKEVKFHKIKNVKAQGWEYFYTVLKTANAWKLHCLPDDWKLKAVNDKADRTLIYSTYLECAQHLKHSINSLRLMKKMMPTNMDLSFLNVLTALRSLNITKGYLKSVYDLDLLLQHVPMLEELEVDFKKTSFISDHNNGGIILTREYPSIKTLNFRSFVFQTDQQACIFYANFTGLKKLYIAGVQNELTLKPETAKKFFTMLLSLLDYDFKLRGAFIDKFDFINANYLQETHASVYNHKKKTDAVDIQKSKDFPDGMINYYFTDDRAVATHVLLRLGPYIQRIQFNNVDNKNIQHYLEVIFSNKHKNLHTIVFNSLAFLQLSKANFFFTSGIQTILFDNCKLSEYALKELSLHFTNLKVVNFKDSASDESFDNRRINIILPNTDIQQLSVTCSNPLLNLIYTIYPGSWDPRMLPFVSVTLTDEGVTRYYYTRDERVPEIVETTKKHFKLVEKGTLEGYVDLTTIVIIHVKSIRELTLKLNNNLSRDIIMVFKPLKKL